MNASRHVAASTTLHASLLPQRVVPLRLRWVCLALITGLFFCFISKNGWARSPPPAGLVKVQISKQAATLVAGQWIEFDTVMHNNGAGVSPPIIAHLAIAALDKDRYVDPEDWAPARTQYVPPLQPGESFPLPWRIRALTEGAYVGWVNAVAAQEPFLSTVSAPLRLQVTRNTILPMNEVVPVVAVIPGIILIVWGLCFTYSRRKAG